MNMAYLINLINQDQWVCSAYRFQTLHNLARHSSHIRSPVTLCMFMPLVKIDKETVLTHKDMLQYLSYLDLSYITQTTDRETVKFPIKGMSNRSPNAGLTNTWRPCQANDLSCNKRKPQEDSQHGVLHVSP